jgi:hypothetical protein
MNAKLRLSLLLLAIGIAIAWPCLISPQSAFAQANVVTENFQIPYSQCGVIDGIGGYCAEYVAHIVAQTTITPGGRINVTYHQNIDQFQGYLIDSGLGFHGSQSVNGHENYSGAAPYNSSWTVAFTAITQGSKDNLIIITTIHITINANGEVTAYVENMRIEYRG